MKRAEKLNKFQVNQLSEIITNTDSTVLEVRRVQAVLLINKEVKGEELERLTGYNEKHAYRLRQRYCKDGIQAIIDKRKPKPRELLTRRERKEILKTLQHKTPNEIDSYYNSDYWSTGILGEYIKRTYNVEYKSKTSYYLIFRRAKFTYHKPGKVYEKRNEEVVKRWREETKPLLEKAFAEESTVILAEDEMILSTQTTFQKIWLPQGEYPRIEVSNTKKNRSVYGFLNLKTHEEHAFKTERQNMYITTSILQKIRSIYPHQHILLLWDGAGWHRGSEVQKWIKSDRNIHTHYFPSYSPEENPEEHVWKAGRSHVIHNHFIKNIDDATNAFVTYLNTTKFPYKILGLGCTL